MPFNKKYQHISKEKKKLLEDTNIFISNEAPIETTRKGEPVCLHPYATNQTNPNSIWGNWSDYIDIMGADWEDGDYRLNVYANDTGGNMTNKSTYFVLDKDVPVVTLHYPGDHWIIGNKSISFQYIVTSDVNIVNTSLEINDVMLMTNSTPVVKGEIQYFNVTFADYGYYIWNIHAIDENGKEGEADLYRHLDLTYTFFSPYPANNSENISRPPANVSIRADSQNVTVYFSFINRTPIIPVVETFAAWTDSWLSEFSFSSFYSNITNWLWGNTTYVWWVNVTDGITWNNATYYYSTEATVSGHNLRYDVSNDGTINVLDLSADWASNTIIGGEYNGFYDVNTDTEVNVLDLSKIWSDNSVGG